MAQQHKQVSLVWPFDNQISLVVFWLITQRNTTKWVKNFAVIAPGIVSWRYVSIAAHPADRQAENNIGPKQLPQGRGSWHFKICGLRRCGLNG
jgi:hypothetical protein